MRHFVKQTDKTSFEDEAPLLNIIHNATAVATVAARATTPDEAHNKISAPTKQSADQLSVQPTDFDKSKVLNAMSLFRAKPHEKVFDDIAKTEPIVAGLFTIEPVALQRNGTQRYYQRSRLKSSTRAALLVIKELILIFLLVASYSLFLFNGAINRNSKITINYWASMASVLMLTVVVVSLISKLITLNRLRVKSVHELILKCNFAYFVTPSKVIQHFEAAQEVCKRQTIKGSSFS